MHVGLTDITRGAGEWLMWYIGGDASPRETRTAELGTVRGLGLRCGLARSVDGLNWTRVRGPMPNGALFDYAPERLYAAWPNVLWDGRRYIMQYTAPEPDLSFFWTMTATSPDGRKWTQQGPLHWADGGRPFDAGGIVTRQTMLNPLPGGRRFLMIYTATDAHHARSIGAADSDDGLAWYHLYDESIFRVGAAGAWDDFGVAQTDWSRRGIGCTSIITVSKRWAPVTARAASGLPLARSAICANYGDTLSLRRIVSRSVVFHTV